MLNTKGMRFPIDVILVFIRWYAAYPLSYRHLEEMMQERGVKVEHSSILSFKSFRSAARALAEIELMHMIRKGQMAMPGGEGMSFAEQFYALTGQVRPA